MKRRQVQEGCALNFSYVAKAVKDGRLTPFHVSVHNDICEMLASFHSAKTAAEVCSFIIRFSKNTYYDDSRGMHFRLEHMRGKFSSVDHDWLEIAHDGAIFDVMPLGGGSGPILYTTKSEDPPYEKGFSLQRVLYKTDSLTDAERPINFGISQLKNPIQDGRITFVHLKIFEDVCRLLLFYRDVPDTHTICKMLAKVVSMRWLYDESVNCRFRLQHMEGTYFGRDHDWLEMVSEGIIIDVEPICGGSGPILYTTRGEEPPHVIGFSPYSNLYRGDEVR